MHIKGQAPCMLNNTVLSETKLPRAFCNRDFHGKNRGVLIGVISFQESQHGGFLFTWKFPDAGCPYMENRVCVYRL